ncbi:glycosyltransferase [Rhabdothermincola salaria]|uniref:glycosyltransferase n=1 Tax=Rhabdothermincola salaria TaxID=2903142 RepID=UPI001E65126F|nr:glycosyltransferase [Rhabdothermincola salaria]MCD9623363.1 glycosyltransferase [Rhabdothermincola salaria]
MPDSSMSCLAPTASGASVPGAELLAWSDLAAVGVSLTEVHRRAAFSGTDELLTSLKPALLRLALQRGFDTAVWLDADSELHGDLSPLLDAAAGEGLALVPRVRAPLPDDGRRIDDASLLTEGLVDPGCVAVTSAADELLAWWEARARRDCLLDPPGGLLLDRRWLEALVVFGARLVTDPGVGVSYVNLHERRLDGSVETGWTVDGEPLHVVDFGGFDPQRPWLLSAHQGDRPRVRLSDAPPLRALLAGRLDALTAAQRSLPSPPAPWPLATAACGLDIDQRQRSTYRRELLAAEAAGTAPPPDPFDDRDPDAYRRWLAEPVGGTIEHPRSRWGQSLLDERIDLRITFPHPDGADAARFHAWLQEWAPPEGAEHGLIAAGVEPDPRPQPVPGCNVVGFLGLDRGVGQAARALGTAVEAAGFPVHRLDLPDPGLPPGRRALEVDVGPYDVNLLSVNPNEVALLAASAAHRPILEDRRNIGLWFWEVDRLPEFMVPAFDVVDEIWVASRYNQELFAAWTETPVEVFPHPVLPGGPTHLTRADLGLPEGYLFGFFFDHLSIMERKNPVGLVEAWKRAFAPTDGAALVLKSINGQHRATDVERLRLAIGDRDDIVVIDDHLSGTAMRALYALIDAYVSLHRSEGFGQTLADAMAHAKPVIATGYSANLDYMHADNGYLVSWTPTPVGDGSWPYPPEATWAEPDIDEAAAWMRHLFENPDDGRAKGERARRDILAGYSLARSAAFVAATLGKVW